MEIQKDVDKTTVFAARCPERQFPTLADTNNFILCFSVQSGTRKGTRKVKTEVKKEPYYLAFREKMSIFADAKGKVMKENVLNKFKTWAETCISQGKVHTHNKTLI